MLDWRSPEVSPILIFLCFWMERPKQYPRCAGLFPPGQYSWPVFYVLSICWGFSDIQQDYASKEVQLLSQRRGITLLSPGKSNYDASTDSNSPERPFEITEVGRKRYCPKYRFMYNITKKTNKGLVHHETALQLKENSSYIPMQVGRESVFLLTLRWRAFSYMV